MKPFIPNGEAAPRPGCPCCKGKYMESYNDRSQATKSAHRAGRKGARREIRKAIRESLDSKP